MTPDQEMIQDTPDNLLSLTSEVSSDTVEAVRLLDIKGRRFKLKGMAILAVAAVLAAVAGVALYFYYGAAPATTFSGIEIPELKSLSPSPTIQASHPRSGGLEGGFGSPLQHVVETLSGNVVKGLAIIGIVMSGLLIAIGSDLKMVFPFIFFPGALLFLPPLASNLLDIPPNQSEERTLVADSPKFVQQLVDEKRYAELAAVTKELLPPDKAAYVRAQVAHINGQAEAEKAELQILRQTKAGISAERLYVMEKATLGAPQSPAAMDYEGEARGRMKSREAVYGNAGALSLILTLVGGTLFGFGYMIERRARRLIQMLGANTPQGKADASDTATDSTDVSPPAALESKSTHPDWVPAWKRSAEPVPVNVGSAGGSGASAGGNGGGE